MPVIDITNTDVIKFLNETYEKTAKLRMRWNVLHKGCNIRQHYSERKKDTM